nr:MAG TPA: hypothetical protein [Bacteriophage sp.]
MERKKVILFVIRSGGRQGSNPCNGFLPNGK